MRILRVPPGRGLAALLLVLAHPIAWSRTALADPSATAATPPRPTPLADADEIHWTLIGPGAVTLSWRGTASTVRYGTTTAYGATATAVTPVPLPTSSAGPFQEARLTGLASNTVYHYSIGTHVDHTFRTPPAPGTSGFSIDAEGDIGSTLAYWRVGEVQSLIAADSPRFVLALGDLTYGNDHGMAAVDQHFNDAMAWSQDAAYMPVWGNHDWEPIDTLDNYKGRFDLPNPRVSPGSPTGGGEDWYWFDYGNARFIAYPEPWSGAWADWSSRADAVMDSAQADPDIAFIVTFGHRPAYSSGWHSGEPTLEGYLDALGASHSKYVLNLNGHSHDYERTYPQSGVVHVTVGTGGSGLEQSSGGCLWNGGCPAPSWSAYRAMHHGALRLSFTAQSIQAAFLCGPPGDATSNINDVTCTQGSVLDAFTIGGPADAAPIVAAPASTGANVGNTITVSVLASDPDGDAIASLSADLSALPPGNAATFTTAPDHRSGSFTWTPASGQDGGPYLVRFTAENALASSATTSIVVMDPNANLAGNPSFESGTTGWSAVQAASIARVSGGHDGSFALRVGASNGHAAQFGVTDSPDWVAFVPFAGATHRFTAWVRSSSATSAARLQVREFLGGSQQGATTLSPAVTLTPSWQKLTVDRVTVAAGSTLDFQVLEQPVVRREEFDLDDVSIRILPSVSAAPDDRPIAFAARFAPNPTRGGGAVQFALPAAAATRVEVLDLQGRLRRTLIGRATLAPGAHAIPFDGRDQHGARLVPGVYFFRITSGSRDVSDRFLVVE
jgi:hypothetical protein